MHTAPGTTPTNGTAPIARWLMLSAALIAFGCADRSVGDASSDDDDTSSDDDDDSFAPTRVDELLELLRDPTVGAAARDTLLHTVAWDEGWPVTDGRRWLFATRWDDAPAAVALVGDINGWAVDAAPAERSTDGLHHFVVIDASSFAVPAAGALYKWWGQGDTYRAPPEATAYGFDEFGAFGYVAPPNDRPWRERFPELDSGQLDLPRSLRALLPAGFVPSSASAAGARTLLMHDGQNVFHPDAFFGGWRLDEILAEGTWGDVVVLAVDNAPDRLEAYSHAPDTYDPSEPPSGGRADDYVALLRDAALPFFRTRYGVSAEGASLMVSGSSMGGLVSLYMAMQYPEMMGCVGALSPSLWWGAQDPATGGADALVNRWPAVGQTSTAIYLDSGGGPGSGCVDADGDGVQDDGDGGDSYCETAQLRDLLADLGYSDGATLFHWWEPDALHNEAAWSARFFRALDACTIAGWQ